MSELFKIPVDGKIDRVPLIWALSRGFKALINCQPALILMGLVSFAASFLGMFDYIPEIVSGLLVLTVTNAMDGSAALAMLQKYRTGLINIKECFSKGFSAFGRIILLSMIFGLIFYTPLAIIIGVAFYSFSFFVLLAGVMVILGVIFLCWFLSIYGLALQFCVGHGLGAVESLKASRALTYGNRWFMAKGIFWAYLIYGSIFCGLIAVAISSWFSGLSYREFFSSLMSPKFLLELLDGSIWFWASLALSFAQFVAGTVHSALFGGLYVELLISREKSDIDLMGRVFE
ncbi:MAG: hypothetical protein LBP22_00805 [Deltaproteobacteria bacterium]|jgi:hypothetical protein|nr:hypothetical protein [Deltaproteobacteria bacterium]